MFAKKLVTQSMIDAVNQVLGETSEETTKPTQLLDEEKKQMLLEPELDETGFHKAAHAAKKAGQSHFEFQGKKYPVTAKSHAEAVAMEEEKSEKVHTPTGMKVYGHRYGNAAKAHRDQTKHELDKMKGPKEKDLKEELDEATYTTKRNPDGSVKSGAVDQFIKGGGKVDKSYYTTGGKSSTTIRNPDGSIKKSATADFKLHKEEGDCVTEPEAKKIAKKEVKHHNVTMHKGQKNTVKMENYFTNKLLNSLNEAKSTGTEEIFSDNNMGEEEMTDAQMKKREKIVMSMKKGMAGFKQRYGKNWKNVMYATATKQAMKEDSSDTWEGEELEEASPAKNQDIADKAYLKHKPGTVKGTMTQLGRFLRGKPEIKEETIEEGNKSHTHAAHYENDKGEWTGMNLLTAKDDEDAIKQAHAKCKEGCRLSRVERHIAVKESVEVVNDKNAAKTTTDMLRGRVEGGKLNSFKNYKVNLVTSGEESIPKETDEGEDTREKQKITTNPGPVDIKFDDKLGHPTVQSHFSSEHQITHEQVQVDEKVIAGTPGWEKIKGADTKGNIKDKSGAVHTPMSRARDLARKSFKKLKQETMMGKISN